MGDLEVFVIKKRVFPGQHTEKGQASGGFVQMPQNELKIPAVASWEDFFVLAKPIPGRSAFNQQHGGKGNMKRH